MQIDLKKYKSIVFDCDGVVLDSNVVKTEAYFRTAKNLGATDAQAQASLVYAQRLVVLQEGRVRAEGSPRSTEVQGSLVTVFGGALSIERVGGRLTAVPRLCAGHHRYRI